MITVEKIEISETTTSFRVAFGEVDFKETLDQRYRRHREAMERTDSKDRMESDERLPSPPGKLQIVR